MTRVGRLQDRVAIVTGGGDGIGHGICRRFVAEGAKVLVAEINEERGRAVTKELISELGGEALFFPADVTRKEPVLGMVAAAKDQWGTVDILVNNAWGGGALGRVENKTDAEMAHGMNMGFYGPLWAMQAAFPIMRAGPRQHHQLVLAQRRQRAHRLPRVQHVERSAPHPHAHRGA